MTEKSDKRAERGLDAVLSDAYDQLRSLAESYLRRERADHTLQPTALVHEVYLRLAAQERIELVDRARFFGLAGEMMRRILVNHAHAKNAEKRGGGAVRVTLDDSVAFLPERDLDFVQLDEALTRLAAFDERQGRIVELRFFAGLDIEETSDVLGISAATVKREWTSARAWLRRELETA